MDDVQFDRLLKTLDRNTEAQIENAKAVHRLADECVTLATMLVDPDEGIEVQATDLAGRPIGG